MSLMPIREGTMAKSIKELVEEAILDMIADGKIIINDAESGDKIDDLEVAIASDEDEIYDEDSVVDEDEEDNE